MDVFVYGTLTDPDRAASVVETVEYLGPATLVGLHRVNGRYPTLAPSGTTEGRLLRTPDVSALDRYEGVDQGLYVRVSIPWSSATYSGPVDCYVGDPDALDASADWPGEGAFETRVRRYVHTHEVAVTD